MEPKTTEQAVPQTTTTQPSAIRTMKGDVALAITRQKETLVSIAMAEEKKKQAQREAALKAAQEKMATEALAPKPRGRIFLVVVLIILVAVAVLGYFFVLPRLGSLNFSLPINTPVTPPIPEAPVATTTPRVVLTPSIIPAQAELVFSIKQKTLDQVFHEIANERTQSDTSWEIKNFIITDEVTQADGTQKTVSVSANRLVTLAGSPTPEILARSLQNTFMAGLLNEQNISIPTPFLILKVTDRATGIAGMLQWEQKLPRLFDTMFGTAITAGLSPQTKTRDVIIAGRDARVLEIAPNIGIAYSFADQSTVVIAGSRTALEKIISTISK